MNELWTEEECYYDPISVLISSGEGHIAKFKASLAFSESWEMFQVSDVIITKLYHGESHA